MMALQEAYPKLVLEFEEHSLVVRSVVDSELRKALFRRCSIFGGLLWIPNTTVNTKPTYKAS